MATRHGGSVSDSQFPMVLKVHEIESIHFRVLRLLEANPAMNQRELARELGLSLGKTNYCLRALLDKGMLKMHNFQSSERKLAYAYLLTPSGIAEKAALTGRFLQRKVDEYALLKAEIEFLKQENLAFPSVRDADQSLQAQRSNP